MHTRRKNTRDATVSEFFFVYVVLVHTCRHTNTYVHAVCPLAHTPVRISSSGHAGRNP